MCLRDGVKSREKYTETVRAFCFKLHFLSPRAYEFVRKEFDNTLPHTSTIKSWYRNSNLDAEPGINQSSLLILERMASEMKEKDQQLVCSLTFDEMSIRKHIQWCSKTKQFLGNVTYGNTLDQKANNAIVFLANGINSKIQVPVAYHFITSLTGRDRMIILLEILAVLFKRGVIIANITFDGLPANINMCTLLEASFKDGDMRTYFIEPYSQRKIYIISDPSHCIKLIRNNLFGRKEFVDAQALVEYGEKNDFGLTHKLTNRHIDFKNRKMHVRTALQTISNSVADSLEFLMKQKIRGFSNASAQIKFNRIINKLFDIMNTQKVDHDQSNKFKSAINFFNFEEVLSFMLEAKEYILELKVRGLKSMKLVPIVEANIKRGFVGFLIIIESVINLYREYVDENNLMHMIPTYKLSQDHVEMFFCKIRSVHRFNDNPTVQQFKASYKKIQLASDITISRDANISTIEPAASTNILTIASGSKKSNGSDGLSYEEHSVEEMEEIEHDLEDKSCNSSLTFVAFEIESRLLKADGCSLCKRVFRENEKVEVQNCIGSNIPCRSTYEICRAADTAIRRLINHSNKNFNAKVIHSVIQNICIDEM